LSILEKLSIKPFAVIGHRGAAGRAPENTLKAIDYAVSVGVDVVEVDARVTRDGVLIVLHDPDFKRLTGLDIAARSVDYAWIKENIRVKGEPVPTLEEVLEYIKDKDVGLFIEVKEPDTTRGVVELVAKHSVVSQVAVISFHGEALATTRRLNPDIVTGLIYAQPPGRVLDAVKLGARVILPHFRLATGRTLGLAHRYGLKVVAWTVNSTEDALRLVEAGVDTLASDIPDELVRLRKELQSPK